MAARLLFQLDTDRVASIFDTVVAYDGGAEHVIPLAGITEDEVGRLVEGAIFTRGPRDKKSTALFLGGTNLDAGARLLAAVQRKFFAGYRVSVMLDSSGANTTAAACVALLATSVPLAGTRALVLGGTGPVGQRVAGLLARAGADVTIAGRQRARTERAASAISARFSTSITARETPDARARAEALAGMDLVCSTGALGQVLLSSDAWQSAPSLAAVADLNVEPPAGIEGLGATDKGVRYGSVQAWGPLAIGALKLKLHRACIARLFEANDVVLDAERILDLARALA